MTECADCGRDPDKCDHLDTGWVLNAITGTIEALPGPNCIERQNMGWADDLLCHRDELLAQRNAAYDLLGVLNLYINWRYVTSNLTTEERELWSDAVDRWGRSLSDGSYEPEPVDRWWR